jgi:hypothetical protein
MGEAASEAVLWISDSVVDDAGRRWVELRRAFAGTGLWPLVLETLSSDSRRPWDLGEFDPGSSTNPDGVDVASTLAGWWSDAVPDHDEVSETVEGLEPFGGEFPGLAPVPDGGADEDALDRVAARLVGRLGLVPVSRPADVVAVLGWQGPANYFNDVGPLSAVLRSWEDRFGAEPIAVGFDTLTLGVRRPPATQPEALAVAAEHFAACPDIIEQGFGSIGAYARAVRAQPTWSYWWD